MIRLLLIVAVPIAIAVTIYGVVWLHGMWGLATLRRKLAHNDALFEAQVSLQGTIEDTLDRHVGALRQLLIEDEEGVAFLTTSQRAAIETVVAMKREES